MSATGAAPDSGFLVALRAALAEPEALRFGGPVSVDKSRFPGVQPLAVALPATVSELSAVVRACARWRVSITPRGAGTGLEGGAIPLLGGVLLDTSRLDRVDVLPDQRLAVVGAGVRKLELAQKLQPFALCFGPDPASNPSLGGMASTGGSGTTTLRYGTTRENVVSMVVVTPAGEVIRTRSAVRKSSTGLDLNQLYLGAEGTLGVIAELTLRLFPVPTARAGTVLRFRSVGDASSAVLALLAAAPPTLLRCELLNAEAVTATNLVYRSSFQPAPTLFIECAGTLPSDVRRDAGAAAAIAQRCGCTEIPAGLTEGAALDELWELRRGCYPAAMAYRAATGAAPAGGKPDCVLITDVCVPLPELPAMIAATEADFETHGLLCVICAHIADGNFHALVPYSTPAEAAACHEAEARLIERAIAVGGTVSGEHGVGMGKIEHCLREHGREHLRVQASIKAALDPHGIMNPGKVYLGDAPLPCAKL